MLVSVTAMSLTLKSRATTSARSIGKSGIGNSLESETPPRKSNIWAMSRPFPLDWPRFCPTPRRL